MTVHISKENGVVIVSVKGKLGAVTVPEFNNKMEDVLAESERYLVINLGELEYISSAGLRSILVLSQKLKNNNGKLVISDLKNPVKEIFEISGFASMLQICESEGAAMNSFN